jgi:hypothetical protein
VPLEGLGELKKEINDLVGSLIHDCSASSLVPKLISRR